MVRKSCYYRDPEGVTLEEIQYRHQRQVWKRELLENGITMTWLRTQPLPDPRLEVKTPAAVSQSAAA